MTRSSAGDLWDGGNAQIMTIMVLYRRVCTGQDTLSSTHSKQVYKLYLSEAGGRLFTRLL